MLVVLVPSFLVNYQYKHTHGWIRRGTILLGHAFSFSISYWCGIPYLCFILKINWHGSLNQWNEWYCMISYSVWWMLIGLRSCPHSLCLSQTEVHNNVLSQVYLKVVSILMTSLRIKLQFKLSLKDNSALLIISLIGFCKCTWKKLSPDQFTSS